MKIASGYCIGDFVSRMLGAVRLVFLGGVLLLVALPAVGAAGTSSGQRPLPYAPPPIVGFGSVLCAPVFACAPPNSAPATSSGKQRLEYEQTRPQREIPFEPVDFDKYAGYYEFGFPDGHVLARVYRHANRYYWQVENAGQPPTEFFPESPTKFFATEFAAQLSFVRAPDGHVTELILHEMGIQHIAHRVSRAVFEAWLQELRRRISDDRPTPGTDAALRRYLETVKGLGTFEGLKFVRVGPHGWNAYDAAFADGELHCFIAPLASTGKVNGLECQKAPRPAR
jgi:hypothetical protein